MLEALLGQNKEEKDYSGANCRVKRRPACFSEIAKQRAQYEAWKQYREEKKKQLTLKLVA